MSLFATDSERTVIGAILLGGAKYYHEMAGILVPEHFSSPQLRALYEAAKELDARKQPIDLVTVKGRLEAAGAADLFGRDPVPFMAELTASIVTLENLGYHATQVRLHGQRRTLTHRLRALAALGLDESLTPEEFTRQAEQSLLEAFRAVSGDVNAHNVKAVLKQAWKSLEERHANKGKPMGIITGIGGLDNITGGLRPGELTVIGARPSMGKTAFVLNVVSGAAASAFPSLFISLEMTNESLADRLAASEGSIDAKEIRSGDLGHGSWVRYTSAVTRLAERPIWFCDHGGMTLDAIRSLARQWRARWAGDNIGLIVVDYLQIVSHPQRKRDQGRERDVAEISMGLKQLAKELGCHVIALSQLNRTLENRADKRPIMADLRESGAIEQDADLIGFLYREVVYNPEAPAREAELIIGKNRHGPTMSLPLWWDGQFTRFTYAHERETREHAR